ncbi:2-oxo acid dehydrogenase subunit E2 [Actinocorallia longicatena]|uniref:Dihydrolipoamide acetyltransferase component of pyruvate dehydrogenase complex n=1 Tax=Actinocorallia longicatena TaxID=111803 RepID=A0ABP6PXJ7_9ACTN
MTEISVPKLNTNDSEYVLVDWLAEDGAELAPGDPVALIETSKAIEELLSEEGGTLSRLLPAGATCRPGQPIARVGEAGRAAAEEAGRASGGPVVTGPARALMDAHGIDEARVAGLGLTLVRSGDIESLLGAAGTEPLPAVQRGVAATVTRSWQTVPAAFTAIQVDVTGTLAAAARLTRELRTLVGLPELLIEAVAGLHGEFPLFFAELDGLNVRHSGAPHVGLTIDLGKGLYVPVIRDAARLGLREISRTAMRHRMTALRGAFADADLAGSNILVALNTDADAVIAIPIVFPGHACAISLCAPRPELYLDEEGAVAQRSVVTLGLAYDHRLVNGREALQFLQALRGNLEGKGAA